VADAITLLGHASYLTSLKRREFLRPDIAPAYQSVCSKSNPVTTNLFGDELPKHIKEIGEVNKIARKTTYRANTMPKPSYDYKSNLGNHRSQQRGNRRAFLGSRGQKGPYFDRRSHFNTLPQPPRGTRIQRTDYNLLVVPTSVFVSGKLAQHISYWRELTSDPWLLETVTGYHLEFDSVPVQSVLPRALLTQQTFS
jgi:hypothetical protein